MSIEFEIEDDNRRHGNSPSMARGKTSYPLPPIAIVEEGIVKPMHVECGR